MLPAAGDGVHACVERKEIRTGGRGVCVRLKKGGAVYIRCLVLPRLCKRGWSLKRRLTMPASKHRKRASGARCGTCFARVIRDGASTCALNVIGQTHGAV